MMQLVAYIFWLKAQEVVLSRTIMIEHCQHPLIHQSTPIWEWVLWQDLYIVLPL